MDVLCFEVMWQVCRGCFCGACAVLGASVGVVVEGDLVIVVVLSPIGRTCTATAKAELAFFFLSLHV